MKYLGIDYGTKRVGIALSDMEGLLAYPHSVIAAEKDLHKVVLGIASREQVGTIVIGESHNFSGEPNPIMKKIIIFRDALTQETPLPVVFEPEVLTSQEAKRIQGENDLHDASAAAVMLQSYLDRVRGSTFG